MNTIELPIGSEIILKELIRSVLIIGAFSFGWWIAERIRFKRDQNRKQKITVILDGNKVKVFYQGKEHSNSLIEDVSMPSRESALSLFSKSCEAYLSNYLKFPQGEVRYIVKR